MKRRSMVRQIAVGGLIGALIIGPGMKADESSTAAAEPSTVFELMRKIVLDDVPNYDKARAEAGLAPITDAGDERVMLGQFGTIRGPMHPSTEYRWHFARFCTQHGGKMVARLCYGAAGTPTFLVQFTEIDSEGPPAPRGTFLPIPVTVSYEIREAMTVAGQQHLVEADKQMTVISAMIPHVTSSRTETQADFASVERGSTVCAVHGTYPVDYFGYIDDQAGRRLKVIIGGWEGNFHLASQPFERNQVIWDSQEKWRPCAR